MRSAVPTRLFVILSQRGLRFAQPTLRRLPRPLMPLDLRDLAANRILGDFQIVARLDVHPERRRGAEEFAQPERGVGGDRRLLARQPLDARARHAELRRHGIRRELHRLQELLAQDFAGMDRRSFFAIAFLRCVVTSVVIVDDLDILGPRVGPPEHDPPLSLMRMNDGRLGFPSELPADCRAELPGRAMRPAGSTCTSFAPRHLGDIGGKPLGTLRPARISSAQFPL